MRYLFTTTLLIFILPSQGQEVLWDTTFVVNETEFTILACRTDTGNFAQLVKSKTDTITIDGVSGNIDVLKFDRDEFPDITFSYIGNNYTADLFIYDINSNTYQRVSGFTEVSSSKRLNSNPNYYYSYHRAGCADLNWMSHLFYIDNFQVYQVGEIYVKGCNVKESERAIEISKIVTLDKIFIIETLPIDTLIQFDEYKWGFIRDYWNKNYQKFKTKNSP